MPKSDGRLPMAVQQWLLKAKDDELNAESILRHRDGTGSGVCFLSQQMAEKYLKAVILYKQRQLPKIHSLDRLLEMCILSDHNLEVLKNDAVYLTVFYIETRYPADYREFSWSEAEAAIHAAQRIKQLCLEVIMQ